MAFLEKVLKKPAGFNMDDFLNNLDKETDESLYEDADAFVKPMVLKDDSDKERAVSELKKGNFILLNITDLSKRNAIKLRDLVTDIKGVTEAIDGDIARISQDHVLATPSKVKIVKRREPA